jgi:hypothetical protein
MSLKNHRKKQFEVETGELRTMLLDLPSHMSYHQMYSRHASLVYNKVVLQAVQKGQQQALLIPEYVAMHTVPTCQSVMKHAKYLSAQSQGSLFCLMTMWG